MILTPERSYKGKGGGGGAGKNANGQPLPPIVRVDQRPPQIGRGDRKGNHQKRGKS